MANTKRPSDKSKNEVLPLCCVRASIPKHNRHDHFWIDDGFLYESYKTIRGLRYRQIIAVGNMPDVDVCSDACMVYIAKEYLP